MCSLKKQIALLSGGVVGPVCVCGIHTVTVHTDVGPKVLSQPDTLQASYLKAYPAMQIALWITSSDRWMH